MRRRGFLQWLGILLITAGCGGGGTESGQSGFTPPAPRSSELLKLVASRQLADKRWQYDLAVDLKAIAGDKSALFVKYNDVFDRSWAVSSVSDNASGWANFQITSYDRLVKLLYGGSLAANSWATLTGSAYYEPAPVDALYFDLQNGMLLKWNDFVPVQYGGTATDPANVVGFTLQGDQLDIYFNLSHIAGSLANPYWFGDQAGYTKQPIAILDSRGWAVKTITITDGQVIRFTFGGDSLVNNSWAFIKDSAFYNAADDLIVVERQGSTIVAR